MIKRKVYTGGQNYFILTNKLDLYAILQVNSCSKKRGVGPLNGGSQNIALVKKIKAVVYSKRLSFAKKNHNNLNLDPRDEKTANLVFT